MASSDVASNICQALPDALLPQRSAQVPVRVAVPVPIRRRLVRVRELVQERVAQQPGP